MLSVLTSPHRAKFLGRKNQVIVVQPSLPKRIRTCIRLLKVKISATFYKKEIWSCHRQKASN